MEELSTIFGNVGILVAALAGGISLVMFGFAGIQYMTAQGDPQGMSRAKMSVIGAVVGLAIAGLAFVMPGIISRLIIEPAGGERIVADATTDCDQLLKNQLVFQRGASTAGRMNEVIRQIQAQRDDCVSELWNPEAQDLSGTTGQHADSCFGATVPTYTTTLNDKIGDLTIPRTIYTGSMPRIRSGQPRAVTRTTTSSCTGTTATVRTRYPDRLRTMPPAGCTSPGSTTGTRTTNLDGASAANLNGDFIG